MRHSSPISSYIHMKPDFYKEKMKQVAQSFNFSFHYFDDILSLNNFRFKDYIHVIYPNELGIKETTIAPASASYIDLNLYIGYTERLKSKLHEKQEEFNFPIIIIFLFLSSNVPTSPAYGVYNSQLIRYCYLYVNFLCRAQILSNKPFNQEYVHSLLMASLQTFYDRHHILIEPYAVSI